MCNRKCCEQLIDCSISTATWRPARGQRAVVRPSARPYTPSVALWFSCSRPDAGISRIWDVRTSRSGKSRAPERAS
jgi:hypothetical protein